MNQHSVNQHSVNQHSVNQHSVNRALIFDMDGTVLDTLDDLHAALNRALAAFGMPPKTREEVRLAVGNGVRKFLIRTVPGGESNPDFEAVLARNIAEYHAHNDERTRPYPGIPELLRKARDAGFRVGIVSNKVDAATKALTARYFPGLCDAAIGDAGKPDPGAVLRMIGELGATVESSVFIGDSEVDIRTGLASGVRTLGVLWGFREREYLENAGATEIVATTDELQKLLGLK